MDLLRGTKISLLPRDSCKVVGVDYDETFSLVAKLKFLEIVLSLVVHYQWDLHQLDVKMLFSMETLWKRHICRFLFCICLRQEFLIRKVLYYLK